MQNASLYSEGTEGIRGRLGSEREMMKSRRGDIFEESKVKIKLRTG